MVDGRYCTKWSVHDAGSRSVSGGMTKNTATKVVIAAAVFRSNAPNARAVMPATVTYNAAPTTDRSAPGSDSDAARPGPLSKDWPTKNAVTLAISMVRNTTPANTASFPHSIGSRRGTTVREERIIPVLYSPLISNTPRTPTVSYTHLRAHETDSY